MGLPSQQTMSFFGSRTFGVRVSVIEELCEWRCWFSPLLCGCKVIPSILYLIWTVVSCL